MIKSKSKTLKHSTTNRFIEKPKNPHICTSQNDKQTKSPQHSKRKPPSFTTVSTLIPRNIFMVARVMCKADPIKPGQSREDRCLCKWSQPPRTYARRSLPMVHRRIHGVLLVLVSFVLFNLRGRRLIDAVCRRCKVFCFLGSVVLCKVRYVENG